MNCITCAAKCALQKKFQSVCHKVAECMVHIPCCKFLSCKICAWWKLHVSKDMLQGAYYNIGKGRWSVRDTGRLYELVAKTKVEDQQTIRPSLFQLLVAPKKSHQITFVANCSQMLLVPNISKWFKVIQIVQISTNDSNLFTIFKAEYIGSQWFSLVQLFCNIDFLFENTVIKYTNF